MFKIKHISLIIFGIATLWDGFTTVYGITSIIGDDYPQLIPAVIFALLIAGLMLSTASIFKGYNNVFFSALMKILWIIALLYDLFTSYNGNRDFIITGELDSQKILILVGLTGLVTASPIIISFLFPDKEHIFK